jgi:hypothetical protein
MPTFRLLAVQIMPATCAWQTVAQLQLLAQTSEASGSQIVLVALVLNLTAKQMAHGQQVAITEAV